MLSVSAEVKARKLQEILEHLQKTRPDENWELLQSFARVVYDGLPEWMVTGIDARELGERLWDNFRFFVKELPPPNQLYRGLPGLHVVARHSREEESLHLVDGKAMPLETTIVETHTPDAPFIFGSLMNYFRKAGLRVFSAIHPIITVRRQWERVEWIGDDSMRRAFEVGTLGCLWGMQACFPHMKAQGYGRVVSLCSLNGVNAHMYSVHYNMAKEALRAITRTAAREWADRGITCNILCPAAETEASLAFRKAAPQMFGKIDAMLPMGRMGDPEQDIAPVALFLSTEDSQYLTGNTLFVDGGSHINGTPWAPGCVPSPVDFRRDLPG